MIQRIAQTSCKATKDELLFLPSKSGCAQTLTMSDAMWMLERGGTVDNNKRLGHSVPSTHYQDQYVVPMMPRVSQNIIPGVLE